MPRAVSNSSTLIHLAAVGRFDLLRQFYDEVLVPPAVWREVVDEGAGRPGADEVQQAARQGWLKVAELSNRALCQVLQWELDDGEAEAIALALEQKADTILLDESDGRRVPERCGMAKTGTIGILMRAKRDGKLAALKPELDRLRQDGRFWITDELYRAVLRAVGEET